MADAARMLPEIPDELDVLGDPTLAERIPSEQIPTVLSQLAAMTTQLSARLIREQRAGVDELLDARAAAAMLRVSTDYLYEHSNAYPFVRRAGRKLLFSRNGIQDYIRRGR